MCSPPTSTYLFSISLIVSLQGQPICYLPHPKKQTPKKTKKETMHWRAFSPPPIPKKVTQNFAFFVFFLFCSKT